MSPMPNQVLTSGGGALKSVSLTKSFWANHPEQQQMWRSMKEVFISRSNPGGLVGMLGRGVAPGVPEETAAIAWARKKIEFIPKQLFSAQNGSKVHLRAEF